MSILESRAIPRTKRGDSGSTLLNGQEFKSCAGGYNLKKSRYDSLREITEAFSVDWQTL